MIAGEWVFKNIIDFKGDFFVDIGAYDGTTSSNTLLFENNGWAGICVEPNHIAFEKLKSRKCLKYNCCASDINGIVDYMIVYGYAEQLSGIYEKYDERHIARIKQQTNKHGGNFEIIQIVSKTINLLLLENNITQIDYLSIDVEGGELSVLKGVDLGMVYVISVENNGYNDEVRKYLENNNFRYLITIGVDEIYKNNN